ncbi:MAG: F0F1 ATP synthase subunit B [Alphaproteobacteria bacterium]|nr:F0F1 ATP synthase subunit B [Alphaproteobacteria bacterium]
MEHDAAMPAWLGDVYVIYTAAFVVFVGLAYVLLKKPLIGWLDAQIAAIKTDLEQAAALRAEAEKLLVEYKQKQMVAERDAAAIVAKARAEAEALRRAAEAAVAEQVARMQAQMQERIARAEAEALADIRARAVDQAVAMVRAVLAEKLKGSASDAVMEQALAEWPDSLKNNKNAA